MKLALVFALTGCLSEPVRPHGVGLPIVAGSVVRHKMVTGDLDNDGYDDLVLFGNNAAPQVNPTLFVFFGGETLENPDLRIPVAVSAIRERGQARAVRCGALGDAGARGDAERPRAASHPDFHRRSWNLTRSTGHWL